MAEKPPQRGLSEPPTGSVLLGPREGFVENIGTNIALIKKRIGHEDLTFVKINVGRYTKTEVDVVYIKSIADPHIVDEIIREIRNIDIDGIIDSSYIAEYLNPHRFSIYKALSADEKPDIVVSKLLEGRVAILTDGSPSALSVPYLLLEDIQNSNDYYAGSVGVTMKRSIRLFGGLIAVLLPGFYLAIMLYNFEIIPLHTLIAITNNTGSTLFPPLLEMLFVIILFEIIYEATLIMPKHLGSATSLISALILGNIAAAIGLLSAPTVLVVAISGITMYILPNLVPQIALLRLAFCIIGGLLGIYGITVAAVLLVIYTAGINNFGTPYLAPFAPYIAEDQHDAITKAPLPDMTTRPQSIPNINKTRAKGRK
jgi:spore germination protein KA